MFDEQFKLYSYLDPGEVVGFDGKVVVQHPSQQALSVMDILYVPCKDMFVYSASDHTINVCREHSTVGRQRVHYSLYNRIDHAYLQVKLCWSEHSKILCSVDHENIIYGWEIDSKSPIFQVSRHKEKITNFLALDNHNLFATCSLDKRIVLWSQTTRRVKAVLQGHKRGVKVMSYAKNTLLTAGFECDATAWDLNLYEPSFYLRGHRLPLADVKLMVNADQQDENLRAITVDDGGEFRLWNIFVREKGSGAQLAETLQMFNQNATSDKSMCKIQYLVVPYNEMFSKEKYSDIIAASNKLIHFKPQKISVDFYPPVCMAYSDPNSCVVTAVGKSLYKYDINTGSYHSVLKDIGTAEVTFFLLDGEHNRRIYVGTAAGYLYLINFASGQLIGEVRAHSRDVMALSVFNKKKDHSDSSSECTMLYSGSTDGNIRQIAECGGNLEITHTIENAMGNHRRIIFMESIQEHKVLICFALRRWALFNLATMKRNFLFDENDEITGFEMLGGGGRYDKADVKDYDEAVRIESERILTLVVCTTVQLKVYTIDLTRFTTVLTHTLGHSKMLHFSKVCQITFPKKVSVNYRSVKNQPLSLCLVAGSDEGFLTLWDIKCIRLESLQVFYEAVPSFLANLTIKAPKLKNSKAKASTLMKAASLLRRGNSSGKGFSFKKKVISRQATYAVSSSAMKKDIVGLDNTGNDEEFSNIGGSKSNDTADVTDDADSEHHNEEKLKKEMKMPAVSSTFRHKTAIARSKSVPEEETPPFTGGLSSTKTSFSGGGSDRDFNARKMKRAIGQTSMALVEDQENDDYYLSGLSGNAKKAVYVQSYQCFKAHTDVIHNVAPLAEHGCIVSSSQDGYHRVWNLLGSCLGEMPLPNMTDKMKKDPLRYTDIWKFAAEKIPVTKAHDGISKQIVKNIEQGLYDDNAFVERRKAVDAGLMALQKSKNDRLTLSIKTPADEDRMKLLGELTYDEAKAAAAAGSPKRKLDGKAFLKQASKRYDDDDDGSMCSDTSSVASNANVSSTANSSALFNSLDTTSCAASKSKTRMKNFDSSYESVFDSEDLWNPINKVVSNCSAAFSEASISTACAEGLFDEDAHRMLADVNTDKNKVDVYERAEPSLLLRNLSMSTSLTFPSKNVSFTEAKFGTQKDMYKNANKVIQHKTKFMKNMSARHSIASLRIKQNVSKLGSTISVPKSTVHDEIVLPPLDLEENDEPKAVVNLLTRSRSNVRREASFGLGDGSNAHASTPKSNSAVGGGPAGDSPVRTVEPKRVLNHEKLLATMKKVITVETESVPEWENKRMLSSSNKNSKYRSAGKKTKISILLLERKLATVIKSLHKEVDNNSGRERLTNRMLLPHYKLADLKNFLHIFQSVDEDYSGDLDVDEWIKFFNAMNKSFSPQQARMMFNKIDQNGDGFLSVSDLVPVIFNNATPDQRVLILKFLELELSKRKIVGNDFTTDEELEMLFEHYDSNYVGFIKISVIREKVKGYCLPDAAHVAVMSLLNDHDEDEMVNFSEFRRLFQNYLAIA